MTWMAAATGTPQNIGSAKGGGKSSGSGTGADTPLMNFEAVYRKLVRMRQTEGPPTGSKELKKKDGMRETSDDTSQSAALTAGMNQPIPADAAGKNEEAPAWSNADGGTPETDGEAKIRTNGQEPIPYDFLAAVFPRAFAETATNTGQFAPAAADTKPIAGEKAGSVTNADGSFGQLYGTMSKNEAGESTAGMNPQGLNETKTTGRKGGTEPFLFVKPAPDTKPDEGTENVNINRTLPEARDLQSTKAENKTAADVLKTGTDTPEITAAAAKIAEQPEKREPIAELKIKTEGKETPEGRQTVRRALAAEDGRPTAQTKGQETVQRKAQAVTGQNDTPSADAKENGFLKFTEKSEAEKTAGLKTDKPESELGKAAAGVHIQTAHTDSGAPLEKTERTVPGEPIPEAHRQITEKIVKSLDTDKTTFQMKLKPEGLGQVTVKLTCEDGKVSLQIEASSSATQKLLVSQLGELRKDLTASNYQVTSVDVSVGGSENRGGESSFSFMNGNGFEQRDGGQPFRQARAQSYPYRPQENETVFENLEYASSRLNYRI